MAAWFLVLIALLPTLVYFGSLWILGSPAGNIDAAGVSGSYIGLLLLAAVFSAVGIFGSSITDNQLVAFVLSVFFCYFFYSGFSAISTINVWAESSSILQYLGLDFHYQALGKGLIDIRDVFYLVSVSLAMLFGTRLVLTSRRW